MYKNIATLLSTFFCLTALNAQNDACIDCSLIDPNGICTLQYDPVCGCDGITYSNACMAEVGAGVLYYVSGECPTNNVSSCSTLEGVDLGPCDLVLGYAIVNGVCATISGCSTIDSNGIDWSGALFSDPDECAQSCLCGGVNSLNEHLTEQIVIRVDNENELIEIIHPYQGTASVHIIDMAGRSILETSISDQETIDIHALNRGTYIINVSNGRGTVYSQRLHIGR